MVDKKFRLYRATAEVEVLFVLPDGVRADLAASDYLDQEIEANGLKDMQLSVEELTEISEVPKMWHGANLWGAEECGLPDELTPEGFFSERRMILDEIERHQRAIDELEKRLVAK